MKVKEQSCMRCLSRTNPARAGMVYEPYIWVGVRELSRIQREVL